jgi:hypothetical protein
MPECVVGQNPLTGVDSLMGVPPDLHLVRKVFDVLQLVSCINRHM